MHWSRGGEIVVLLELGWYSGFLVTCGGASCQVLLWQLGIYFHSPSAELEPPIKADSMNTIKFRVVEVKRTGSLTDH